MKRTYDILTWDAKVNDMVDGVGDTLPVLYIVPDKDLLDFIYSQENHLSGFSIHGTDGSYDTNDAEGTVMPSSEVIGFRPNYGLDTQSIAIVLYTRWRSYPLENGSVTITLPEPEPELVLEKEPESLLSGDIDGNYAAQVTLVVLFIYFILK